MAGELRISDYEGTPSATIAYADEGFTSDYGGVASTYSSSSPMVGSTCMTIGGQGGFHFETSFPSRTYWTGWWRSNSTPTSNRLIVDLQAGSSTQCSISIDTARKWRLRNQAGAAVQTSTITYTDGVWYGMVWWADSSTGTQELKIYSSSGTLLETLSGGCGTSSFTRQREGILQGSNDWSCSYDHTAVGTAAIPLTFPSAGFTGSAPFTGSGTLVASGVARIAASGAVSLAGSGTLSATGAAKLTASGSVGLSGSGTLSTSASATEHHAGSVALSGSGAATLAPGVMSTFGAVGLFSSGAVAPAPIPGGIGSVESSSTGTLSLVASVRRSSASALSGTGALSLSTRPAAGRTAPLDGEGFLEASGIASIDNAGSAPLSGSGSLGLTGGGLSIIGVTLDSAGSGALAATAGGISASASVTLASQGTLSTSGSAIEDGTGTADYSGSGQLVAAGVPHFVGYATTFGFGGSAPTVTPALQQEVGLSGAGAFYAGDGYAVADTAQLQGSGALTASIAPGIQWVMVLPSSGSLAASGWAVQHFAGTAALGGPGSLGAAATDTVPRDVTVIARLGKAGARSAKLPQHHRWSADLR